MTKNRLTISNSLKISIKLVLVFAMLFSFNQNVQAEKLLLWSDKWYPLNGDPDTPLPGFGIEILQVILAKEGLGLDYKLAPWSRSVLSAQQGEIDCVIGASADEVKGLAMPKTPIYLSETDFFVRKNDPWRYQGKSSLLGKRLALVKDYTYEKAVTQYKETHPDMISETGGEDALLKNIKLLLNQRVDILVDERAVVNAKLQEIQQSDHIVKAGVEAQDQLFVACHQSRPLAKKLLAIFDTEMEALQKSGNIAKIMARYGLS